MNFNMTLELSESDIKQALADYIRKQIPNTHSVSTADIHFQIDSMEDRWGNSLSHRLTKATVSVKKLGSYMDR